MLLESKLHKLLVFLLFPATVLSAIAAVLTKEEFNSAVTSNGYRAPADDVYNYFAEYTGDFSRDEIAMFIAQLILESGGFKHTEQLGNNYLFIIYSHIHKILTLVKDLYALVNLFILYSSHLKYN